MECLRCCRRAAPVPAPERTLVAMSERTGMSVSQVTDEVLYKGLVEMQELPEHEEWGGGAHWPLQSIQKVVTRIYA